MYIPVTTPVVPQVPPHICPGHKVTCPDCGQEFHTYRAYPWWGVLPYAPPTWSNGTAVVSTGYAKVEET